MSRINIKANRRRGLIMKEYTLRNLINEIDTPKESDYYNESFYNTVLDYMGSVHWKDWSKNDLKILEENGYLLNDFVLDLEEE